MLILSRRVNENIALDDIIFIKVVEIRGDKVRIGIEAPKDIKILRTEIDAKIHNKAEKAFNSPTV